MRHREIPLSRRVFAPIALAVAITAMSVPSALVAAAQGAVPGWIGRTAPVAWEPTQLPVPTGALRDGAGYAGPIACPKVGGCVVLGEYATAAGTDEDLIDTETADVWSSAVAPLPPGGIAAANLGPYTLGCTGVGFCLGTSLYQTATSVAPEILEENGGRWTALAMPMPANASRARIPSLNAMACALRGACVIVGTYDTTKGSSEGFVVTQEGRRFVALGTPVPAGPRRDSSLDGVSCSTATSCVAVGYFVGASGSREALAVSDAAGTLAASSAVLLPSGANARPQAVLQSVSCGRSSPCVALGGYNNAAGDRFGVIDTESNGTWTVRKMPSAPGARTASPSPRVFGITCKAGNYCLAVGQYVDATGTLQGLALLEQAGHWSASMMPGTLDSNVVVRAVACVSDTHCAAAGSLEAGDGEAGYLMTLSGSSLSGTVAPVPAKAASLPDVQLGYVACPWIATCMASGTYESAGTTGAQLPLAVSD
jgi:hypothetical protein